MVGTLDPRICNIHLDANAVDRDGGLRDAMVERFGRLRATGDITWAIWGSVRREASHPRTPADVQAELLPRIYTMPVSRTAPEQARLAKVRTVLRGKALSGKHDQDAEHLFEASKYGGGYFITHDGRLLDKRDELLLPA